MDSESIFSLPILYKELKLKSVRLLTLKIMDECTKWCGAGKERGFSCIEKWQNKVVFLTLIHFSLQFSKAVVGIVSIIMTTFK